ncbi:MAG: response regulator [Bacteroidales bacterium]|jgi:hypothetical protein
MMGTENLKGKKILIVEDDLSSRIYLNKILEKTGAVILNATDGQEAIDITAKTADLAVILMDIQLPVLNGRAAARKIRDFRKDIIIIAQTAYGLPGDTEEVEDSEFDDYIVKPIYANQLIEKLVSLFS